MFQEASLIKNKEWLELQRRNEFVNLSIFTCDIAGCELLLFTSQMVAALRQWFDDGVDSRDFEWVEFLMQIFTLILNLKFFFQFTVSYIIFKLRTTE